MNLESTAIFFFFSSSFWSAVVVCESLPREEFFRNQSIQWPQSLQDIPEHYRNQLKGAPPSPPQCVTPQGNCACKTDQGLVDLSAVDSKDGNKPFFDVTSSFYTFKYNPCTPINQDQCKNAALCSCYSQRYCTVIGEHSSAKFKTDTSSGKLTITYSAGGFYESTVTLNCDKTQEGTLTIDSSFNPYKFTLNSKHACPVSGGSGGLSVGTILIIVFFCLVFVYLVGGIIFMHFARGAQGVEKIPNINFWREFPGLVKDGGSCVYRSVQCGGGPGGKSSNYEQI